MDVSTPLTTNGDGSVSDFASTKRQRKMAVVDVFIVENLSWK